MKGARTAENTHVNGWLGGIGGLVVSCIAGLYLILLGTSTMGRDEGLPGVIGFFTQVAKLFPNATDYAFDYRVEAWVCDERKFVELDYRPYFPLRPDDKENRFQRMGYFYISRPTPEIRPVFEQLGDYFIQRHNAGGMNDGVVGKIGGIRLSDLRLKVPEVGGKIERWNPRPLLEYPESIKKVWYYTKVSARAKYCGEAGPAAPASEPAASEPAASEVSP
jgi:hypothetical protein